MSALPPVTGSMFPDIITYVRRIIKNSQAISITDETIADYINRFYVYDMSARLQLFELKRQYTFETIKNINQYQFPYKLYQLLNTPVYCDAIQMGIYTSTDQFYRIYPDMVLNEFIGQGDDGPEYDFQISQVPILRGFTDVLGYLTPYIFFTAYNSFEEIMYVVDDGNGNLVQTDATFQQNPTSDGPPVFCGNIDYNTGICDLTFFDGVANGTNIEVQFSPFSSGPPRIALFMDNIIKVYPVPDRSYKIQMDVYVTPAQFATDESSVTFAYMSEYLARGAARKILQDTGDVQLLQINEPYFREQENFVLRRTSRQRMAVERTPTIFAQVTNQQNPFLYSQR